MSYEILKFYIESGVYTREECFQKLASMPHAYPVWPSERRDLESLLGRRLNPRKKASVPSETVVNTAVKKSQSYLNDLWKSQTPPLLREAPLYTGSLARTCLLVEKLSDAVPAIYDKDPDRSAFIIGEEGEHVVRVFKTQKVHVPIMELSSHVQVPLTQIEQMGYASGFLEKLKAMLRRAEDTRFMALLDTCCLMYPRQTVSVGVPSTDTLARAFRAIEQHNLRVSNILVNPADLSDFRTWGQDRYSSVKDSTRVFGAKIHSSVEVPLNKIYLVTEPEMVGRMPVRTDLTVLRADNPYLRTGGWSLFEQIGMCIFDPRGVSRIEIGR